MSDEAPLTQKQIDDFLTEVEAIGWASIVGELTNIIELAAQKGVQAAYAQVGVDSASFKLANDDAIEYAKNRGAEMVGMRWEDGELVQNDRLITRENMIGPSPTWAISDTTRDKLTALVTKAKEEGWSATMFKQAIMECDAFSNDRALMIARTEAAFADSFGSLAQYKREGIKKKQAIVAQSEVCDICITNADEGPISIDELFSNGDYAPPFHVNCRCSIVPIIEETETT